MFIYLFFQYKEHKTDLISPSYFQLIFNKFIVVLLRVTVPDKGLLKTHK